MEEPVKVPEDGGDAATENDDYILNVRKPDLVYPPVLPLIPLEPILTTFGLTQTEKAALVTAWRFLKPHRRYHAHRICMNFFADQESLLYNFVVDGKFMIPSLVNHSSHVLEVYGTLIEYGLDHPNQINVLLMPMRGKHSEYGVTDDGCKLMVEYISYYVYEEFKNFRSDNLYAALQKLGELILTGFLD